MKEYLQKIAAIHADIAKAAKEGDNAALITKLEEAAVALEEATTEAETLDTTTVTQSEDISKMQETINKWAYLDIGAETLTQLIADVKSVTDQVASLSTIAKTVEDLGIKVETIAKTSIGSQQFIADEKESVTKSTNPLAGLAARL